MRRELERKLRRLTQMSRVELRYRAAGAVRRKLGWLPWLAGDAHREDGWVRRVTASAVSRAELPAYLARVLGSRVYGHDWTPARLVDGLTTAGVADRIVADADELRAHRLRVLGYGVRETGAHIDWHRDLVSGVRWPRRHWGFVPRVREPGRDLKVIWEPSRHQHFLPLAAAAAITGERAYADEVAAQLAGWIEDNPTGIGVHWLEAIEPALRLLTWLWALPLVLDSPRFTPDLCATVLRSLTAQARHIAANLSIYSSPNTHLIAEALALFVLGTVLPELESARRWREQGAAILEREIVIQVGDDGVYREASAYYHAYTVEYYLLALVIAERNGVALAPVVRARLARMVEALTWLARPDGTLPNFGDADGGRALRTGAPNLTRVDELLASGATFYARPDLCAGLAPRGEEAAWLWPDGVARVRTLGWAPPVRGVRHFADARLVVDRRRVEGDERYLLFDAGDLGMLAGAHGHAGCLGIEVHAGGRPLVVDPGTYVYPMLEWRRHFRGTRAHNTVVVDGLDQAEPTTDFQWATRYRSRIVRDGATPEYVVVSGEHDGYGRLPDPVRHRRTLVSVAGEYWLCVDVLEGAAPHDAEFIFHLAPELDAELTDGRVFAAAPDAADGLLIVPAGFASGASAIVRGATDPIQGWHSDDYGEKRPAPTLVTRERVATPAVRAHVLVPIARAARASVTVESHRVDDGLVLVVRGAGFTDLVFCAPGAPRRFAEGAAEFVGELLHARLGPAGELRRFLAVQATTLRWHGQSHLDTDAPADWQAVVDSDGRLADARAVGARRLERRGAVPLAVRNA